MPYSQALCSAHVDLATSPKLPLEFFCYFSLLFSSSSLSNLPEYFRLPQKSPRSRSCDWWETSLDHFELVFRSVRLNNRVKKCLKFWRSVRIEGASLACCIFPLLIDWCIVAFLCLLLFIQVFRSTLPTPFLPRQSRSNVKCLAWNCELQLNRLSSFAPGSLDNLSLLWGSNLNQ